MSENGILEASLTQSVKYFLDDEIKTENTIFNVFEASDSIYDKSQAEGLSLVQYVATYPEQAIREAEASLNKWLNVQAMAALQGTIKLGNDVDGYEEHVINRNTAKLIDTRVAVCQKQVDYVYDLAHTAHKNGERRRDHFIRTLYNRAIHKNDVRTALYLVDRVDGRPGEQRHTDILYDNGYNIYQIICSLFGKQRDVLNVGNGTVLICCSRRAGKTVLLVAAMLIEALNKPNTTCLYLGTTMAQTELLVEQAAAEIIDRCKLKDSKGKRLNWKKLENGSKIHIRGLSSIEDLDQIRGMKAPVIGIDEFFHQKDQYLDYLIKEVLEAMQMDYADDYKFIAIGTPPSIKGTFGETAWRTWDVPKFTWTYKDNPHPVSIEQRDAYVERKLKEKGLDWTSTYARREFLAEWVYDDDILLYPEYFVYDLREGVPQFDVDMILFGLDYGVTDHDCLIGIAWDSANRRGYVFHEDKFNRLDIKDRTISQLEYLRTCVLHAWEKALDFFPTLDAKEANKRILWDADDNNQHLTDEFNVNCRLKDHPTLRLNIRNAHKTDQPMMHDKIRDLFRTAHLLLPSGGKTAKECDQTALRRGPNGQIYPDIDVKIFHPDLLPAMRYALWNVIGQESYVAEGGI